MSTDKAALLAAKMEVVQATLEAQFEKLVTGEEWLKLLHNSCRFPGRSMNNNLLIMAAHMEAFAAGRVDTPMPSYVRGYRAWQELGRQVVKGQHGYPVIQPVTSRRVKDTDGNYVPLPRGAKPGPEDDVKQAVVGWKVGYVFDISQTAGEPVDIPVYPAPIPGQVPEGLKTTLEAWVAKEGYSLTYKVDTFDIGGALGRTNYVTKEVAIADHLKPADAIFTLAHELGHIRMGHQHSSDTRSVKEVEAESFAALVCLTSGLEVSSAALPYIATWTKDAENPVETMQKVAENVRTKALPVIEDIQEFQAKIAPSSKEGPSLATVVQLRATTMPPPVAVAGIPAGLSAGPVMSM